MSLRKLPEIKALQQPKGYSWDVPSDALSRWTNTVFAAEADDPNTISIYDVIGADMFGEGFTAKRLAGALRAVGKNDVTVKINSPGGDVFEGFALYNLLREHPANVTVDIVGIAASAASVIAMAGDEIRMGLGSFVMIHNAWGMVVGNRNDLAEAQEVLEKIDGSIVDIYEARTGMDRKELFALMDAETFMTTKESVENGFADSVFDMPKDGKNNEIRSEIPAKRRLEALLAQTGVPRSERRRLMAEVAGDMPDAIPTIMPDADQELLAEIRDFINNI